MAESEKNEKYDGISITDLEAKVEKLHAMSRENQKEMYECLEYLRMTNRYKENQRYKKSSFWEYLDDRFTIRQRTYRENVRAFTKFPEYALEYGVGIVSKIERLCGGMRVDQVLSEIKQEVISHKRPLPRAKIQSIIMKHGNKERIKREKTNWRLMYEHEKIAHDRTKEQLRIAVKMVVELNEQITKLKKAAETTIKIRKIFSDHDKLEQSQSIS